MHIEELIDRLAGNGKYIFQSPINVFRADATIISSLSDQIQRGNFYTEKQQTLAIRLVSKYVKVLSTELKYDVNVDLVNPQFKNPARKLSGAKSIQLKSYADSSKKIVVQFPFNTELVEAFREYKKTISRLEAADINWNAEDRVWIFGYTESNISYLYKMLSNDFEFDNELEATAKEIQKIEENIEQYVPMIVYQNGHFSYKNVMNHVPQPNSNNLIEVLLHARSCGITCWDESIDMAISSSEVSNSIQLLIKNSHCNPITIASNNLISIQDLLNYSKNILFVIPGGTELDHLKSIHNFLINQNILNSQLTVMFRLDSSSGKLCNEYIKEHKLNTPVSDVTKFVFVSGKIPKPLIETGKKFDLVVHFGTNSAHYTLKNYIKNHHNVISMNLDNKNKELDFG
jgi:hypothetical protein